MKSGGSRMGPRTGSASSTPPKRPILLRIASARFPARAGSCARAVRRYLASSSIDRFRCAARSRNFRFHRLIQIADRDAGHEEAILKSLQSI